MAEGLYKEYVWFGWTYLEHSFSTLGSYACQGEVDSVRGPCLLVTTVRARWGECPCHLVGSNWECCSTLYSIQVSPPTENHLVLNFSHVGVEKQLIFRLSFCEICFILKAEVSNRTIVRILKIILTFTEISLCAKHC